VGISREGLENHFLGLLAMMQPTAELIAKLPDIAEATWQVRSKRVGDEQRTLQTRLNENKSLNLKAIGARIRGELSVDDLAQFKESNDKSIAEIDDQLKALKSESFTMTQLNADSCTEVVPNFSVRSAAADGLEIFQEHHVAFVASLGVGEIMAVGRRSHILKPSCARDDFLDNFCVTVGIKRKDGLKSTRIFI
jgi:hypothetical protein